MNNKNSFIIYLLLLVGVFFNYLSTGNPGLLVACLGLIGALISKSNLINYNRFSYYIILLSVIVLQSIILLNTYLYKMTYLQDSKEYVIFAFGVFAYLFVIILLFKPNLFKENSKNYI